MHSYFEKISRQQQLNGSFLDVDGVESLFCTSLVLSFLNSIKPSEEAKKIKTKAVEYILSKKSDEWKFTQNVGHDFCVISSLFEHDSSIIDGEAMAKILMNLVSIESEEGGPYYNNFSSKNTENQVDAVSNIFVAYFLSLNNVSLPNLDNLIDEVIVSKNYDSNLFVSDLITIFFLSKFYKGSRKDEIIKYILQKNNNDLAWGGFLNDIFATLSLSNLSYSKDKNLQYFEKIKNISSEKMYKTTPLYYHNETSSFCFSAISMNLAVYTMFIAYTKGDNLPLRNDKPKQEGEESLPTSPSFTHEESLMIDEVMKVADKRFSVLNGDIRHFAMREIRRTMRVNTDKQMTLMSYFFRESLGSRGDKFSDQFIAKLGLANVFFWTAFIIYDDFWDEEGEPSILPTANFYARNFVRFFSSIFPNDKVNAKGREGALGCKHFSSYFRDIMDRVDAANTWETVYCRASVKGDIFQIPEKLPDYGDYNLAYDPASAHILGPVAMLYALGCKCGSTEVKNLENYFRGYLIAMQFNDDMHDWEDDLKKGHLSCVVTMLLEDYKDKYPERRDIDLSIDREVLKNIFWYITMPRACAVALEYLDFSKQALSQLNLIENKEYLFSIINIVEGATKKAQKQQQDTVDFLKTYK